MEHTFLFQEGVWLAGGNYYDSDNNVIPVEAKTTITHQANLWLNEGTMKLLSDNPVELENRYEIIPFTKDLTTWKSFNPALGILRGRFMVVEDTIISIYTSENNEYTGCECVVKVTGDIYQSKGFLCKGNEKISSWAVEMKRT